MGSRRQKSNELSNTNPEQPENHTFFTDSCFGKSLAQALRDNGLTVIEHLEKFAADEKDEVWLTEAGKNEWIVLTRDKQIQHRSVEKTALMNSGVAAFVLASLDLSGDAIIE